MMIVEIGAPVYNEEAGVTDFLHALQAAVAAARKELSGVEFHLLLADDGSSDQTRERIRAFPFTEFSRVRVLVLSRNYGHPAAVSALLDRSEGDGLILMDADLQDAPELVPELVRRWQSGLKSVQVARTRRGESGWFRICHFVFSRVFHRLSGLRSDVGIFGIYDRTVVQAIRSYPERLRYIPGIVSSVGFPRDYLPAPRNKRARGESRVGFPGLLRLGFLAWLSYSSIPIHIITGVGFVISLCALIAALVVIGVRLLTEMAIPGWASVLSAQFFLGGLMIFSLGVVGQYIGIIFEEVKQRPIYIIAEEDELRRQ